MQNPFADGRKITILILAGFLITYHSVKIFTLFTEATDFSEFMVNHGLFSLVRTGIIVSLISVIFGQKLGLWLMWISIGLLITLQFLSLGEIEQWTNYLSPLKGLIIPSVITWLRLKN